MWHRHHSLCACGTDTTLCVHVSRTPFSVCMCGTDTTLCVHVAQTPLSVCTWHRHHSLCACVAQTPLSVCTWHRHHSLCACGTDTTLCVHAAQTPLSVCMWHRHHSLCACVTGRCCQRPHALAPSCRPTHAQDVCTVNCHRQSVIVCTYVALSVLFAGTVHAVLVPHLTHSVCAHTMCDMWTDSRWMFILRSVVSARSC